MGGGPCHTAVTLSTRALGNPVGVEGRIAIPDMEPNKAVKRAFARYRTGGLALRLPLATVGCGIWASLSNPRMGEQAQVIYEMASAVMLFRDCTSRLWWARRKRALMSSLPALNGHLEMWHAAPLVYEVLNVHLA